MGGKKKARPRAGANTRLNLPGGFPRSDESSPTPTMRSRNGSAASRVRSASASSRWRRKHMIRRAATPSFRPASAMARLRPSITVANATPRDVWPCGSKNISTWRTLSARAREIGAGKVVEILLRDQHRHAEVVDVEKILQVAEPIGLPHRVDRRIRQPDAVAAR